jgi:hypothetical protein
MAVRLRLDIDDETYARLAVRAGDERRPVEWQAEVELRRALGLPFPAPAAEPAEPAPQEADDAAPTC